MLPQSLQQQKVNMAVGFKLSSFIQRVKENKHKEETTCRYLSVSSEERVFLMLFIYPYQIVALGTGTLRNYIPVKSCGIKETVTVFSLVLLPGCHVAKMVMSLYSLLFVDQVFFLIL